MDIVILAPANLSDAECNRKMNLKDIGALRELAELYSMEGKVKKLPSLYLVVWERRKILRGVAR